MKRPIIACVALLCACCRYSVPPRMQPTFSPEHESDWAVYPADPMVEQIARLAARAPAARTAGGSKWTLGPDLAAGTGGALAAAGALRRLPAPAGSTLPDMPMGWSQEHAIGPGDELDIVVSARPEFSGKIKVRADGSVVLPTAGDLVAVGAMTAGGASEAVASVVYPKYLRERPQVSVEVASSPGWFCYVFGAVAKEGRFPMRPGRTRLLDALVAAGRPRAGSTSARRRPGLSRWKGVRVVTPGPHGPAPTVVDVEALLTKNQSALQRGARLWSPLYVEKSLNAANERKAALSALLKGG